MFNVHYSVFVIRKTPRFPARVSCLLSSLTNKYPAMCTSPFSLFLVAIVSNSVPIQCGSICALFYPADVHMNNAQIGEVYTCSRCRSELSSPREEQSNNVWSLQTSTRTTLGHLWILLVKSDIKKRGNLMWILCHIQRISNRISERLWQERLDLILQTGWEGNLILTSVMDDLTYQSDLNEQLVIERIRGGITMGLL